MNKLFCLIGVLLLHLSSAIEEAPTPETAEGEEILHQVGDFKITIN